VQVQGKQVDYSIIIAGSLRAEAEWYAMDVMETNRHDASTDDVLKMTLALAHTGERKSRERSVPE
jgi:hypothetical protein